MSAGTGGGNATPEKRGVVSGWSAAAVRRHTRWLYSISAPALDGDGYAVTLTMRDIPASSEDFHRARRRLLDRLTYMGAVRVHWVVEWTRRRRPHLHMAVYWAAGESTEPGTGSVDEFGDGGPGSTDAVPGSVGPIRRNGVVAIAPLHRPRAIIDAWLAVAGPWGVGWNSQHVDRIDGAEGWLQYLSKHAARGVAHYQRQGKPPGWEKTGRLWGHLGEWPEVEPMRYEIARSTYWAYRRLVRSWRVADARQAIRDARDEKQAQVARRRLSAARRMLACDSRNLSEVRGVSEWVSEPVTVAFLELLGSRGHVVHQL